MFISGMSVPPPGVGPQIWGPGAGGPGPLLDINIIDRDDIPVAPGTVIPPPQDFKITERGTVYVDKKYVGKYGPIRFLSQTNGEIRVNGKLVN